MITLDFRAQDKGQFDISLNSEQVIQEAIKIVNDGLALNLDLQKINYCKSHREKRIISVYSTFEENNIYTGDRLELLQRINDYEKNEFEKVVKISELNAKRDSEINRVTYENTYLIPCKVNIKDEEVKFTYDLNELQPFSEIKNRRAVEKLRFLINVGSVQKQQMNIHLNQNQITFIMTIIIFQKS